MNKERRDNVPSITVHADLALERVLTLELVRVTERAAVSAARLSGRGNEKAADQAAVEAIRAVVRGVSYVTPLMTEDVIGSVVQHFRNLKSTSHLTPRQKEVLQLLAEGRSMKEAAFILNVSPRTAVRYRFDFRL